MGDFSRKRVEIFTDGACRGNPGPGGYAAVLRCGRHRLELSQGFSRTTNNRMELLAAIAGLESLSEPCDVALFSDSKYLIEAQTKGWVKSWKARGWLTSQKQPVKNQDLWLRMEEAIRAHTMEWNWVKGHAGHAENERCDALAVAAALAEKAWLCDAGFVE